MVADDTAIKVDGVYKSFKLPHEKKNSLKSIFTSLFKQKQKGYETQYALRDISFEVKKGEFFGIVGRNGSGKSTLLKILAEIYRPTKGSVRINGRLVPFIELGVGFNPDLTGRENVYLNGALLGFTTKEIDEQYDDIVSFAELERFMDQKLKNYSSGMQVRLAFAVATRAKAEILLIDEVLAVGDADFQRKCFNYFKSLKKSGTTVVFVSHDMDAVREYCDRAILIDKNQIIESGDTDAVAQKYTQLFIDQSENSQQPGQEGSRWGKGGIVTREVGVDVNQELVSVTYRIEAHADVENLNVGIRVRSVSGDYVTGTNTRIENVKVARFTTDEERELTWSFPNILADGDYYIDTALLEADNITVLDWWDEAALFRVKKNRSIPYLIDPGFHIKQS